MLKLNSAQTGLIHDDFFKDAEEALTMTVGKRACQVLEAGKSYEPLWATFPVAVCMDNAEELLLEYAEHNYSNSLSGELVNMVISAELKAYFAKAFDHLIDMVVANHE